MTHINAYLNFRGNCREAMTFYQKCLGGELTLQTVGETPMADKMPDGLKQHILHSSLIKEGLVLMASDMAREKLVNGNTVNLCVNCSTEDEIKTFFSNLSAGGKVLDPLTEQFWGATYGALVDKFGICWMFNYQKNHRA